MFKTLSVIKRDGRTEMVEFDKITKRIVKLCTGLCKSSINVHILVQKVINGLIDGIHVSQIDDLAAGKAATMSLEHPDYNLLAGRISASNLQKTTKPLFSESMEILFNNGILNQNTWNCIVQNKDTLNNAIISVNDMEFDYFAIQTLKKSYLQIVNGETVETPQYMYMRVACGIHHSNVNDAIDMYNLMSEGIYTHSSPTLFNSGTIRSQMASCFLIDMKDDSIEGIFDTLKTSALISKYAGGVGLNMHKIRSKNSYIEGTNGKSSGIIPWLRLFNVTACAVDQAGRRKGSFAVYLEPHHPDFMSFLNIRKGEISEDMKAKDLFTAVWVSELFMNRVETNGRWTFFNPNLNDDTRLLDNVFDDFDEKHYTTLYEKLEKQGLGTNTVNARDVWDAILHSMIKTGTPYIINKDIANRTSNQKNLGIIKSSNLCAEIIEYSSPTETAVCTLASINLSKFVDIENSSIHYQKLVECSSKVVKTLNSVIDNTFYPTACSELSNKRHRPLGLGISGLQDVFFLLKCSFDSDLAKKINKNIMESIYYGAVLESVRLAKEFGHYETFPNSPASKGIFNFDMWDTSPNEELCFDWDSLRKDMIKYGLRNSLHTALMPTASSASILGVVECFEPQKSNIYKRQVLSGEFIIINKYLVKDLQDIGLWTPVIIDQIMSHYGSIQKIESIPVNIKNIYKTAYELSMKTIIDMAADRSPFVDQSQSLNLFIEKLDDINKLTSMLFYSYKKKMKTIIYYTRIKPATNAVRFNALSEEKDCLSCQV